MTGPRRSAALQAWSIKKPSNVDIVLADADEHSFVSSYSTLDKISGQVLVKYAKDTSFHELEISFEGVTETYIEKVATTAPTSGRATGRHRFLKLLQPIEPSSLPIGRLAKAGVQYSFPFEFVVPDRLLDHQCTHRVESPQVHEAHIHVPPSLGDPMLAGDGQTLQDDMAPEMSKIQYTIRAKMIKALPTGSKPSDVADKAIKVRVVPAVEEDPPLDINEDNKDFELRTEKDVKKGLFRGKLGRIVAEAPQPSAFRLPTLKNRSPCPISTMTNISLRFDPADEKDRPPPLGSVGSKLRAQTFFGSVPFRSFPSRSTVSAWDTQRGLYVQPVELFSRCITSVAWRKHKSQESSGTCLSQRQSNSSGHSISSTSYLPEPSAAYRPGSSFYTARVLVPMSLPQNKSFPPTFHSCSVSRTYVLDLSVSYHTIGATVSAPSIQLRLPIQISAEGNPDAVVTISEQEAEAIAARELDAELAAGRFSPRSVPSIIRIPEYSERQIPTLPAIQGTRRANEQQEQQQQSPPGYSLIGLGRPSLGGGGVVSSERPSEPGPTAANVSVGVM